MELGVLLWRVEKRLEFAGRALRAKRVAAAGHRRWTSRWVAQANAHYPSDRTSRPGSGEDLVKLAVAKARENRGAIEPFLQAASKRNYL
jgi:hypothetical protein